MTGSQVSGLVGDLVAMAKAYEELPALREALYAALRDADKLAMTVMEREESILSLKAELEASHEARRATEVERDDAEFRFLELDERAAKALGFMAQVQGMAVQAEVALNPPKPEPTAEPITPPTTDATPMAITEGSHYTEAEAEFFGSPSNIDSQSSAPEVPQVDPTPVATSTDSPSPDAPSTAESMGNAERSGALPPEIAATPPYAGRRYIDVPGFISRQDWINGGGTEDDYDYRPSARNSDF